MERDDFAKPTGRSADHPAVVLDQIDKRSYQRFAINVVAEVVDLQTQTEITGRVADLGIGGCYVETVNPFAEHAAVAVRFSDGQRTFRCRALVVSSRARDGMGLAFTETALDQEISLLDWVSDLGRAAVEGVRREIPDPMALLPHTGGPRENDLLLELLSLLVRKRLLTESEAAGLRDRLAG